jgi:hypothetical protein
MTTAAPIAQIPSALMLAPQMLTRSLSDNDAALLKEGSELSFRGELDVWGGRISLAKGAVDKSMTYPVVIDHYF